MSHPADRFIKHTDAPRGIVRACTLCKFSDLVLKPRFGSSGRGWGLREGNKQRGRLIQHIKAAHPEALQQRVKEAGAMSVAFACTAYDIDTGEERERYSWVPSGDEARIFFSFKERATLERGEFVEVDDKRRGVTVRYALLEKGRVA